MQTLDFFRDSGLIAPDVVVFAKSVQILTAAEGLSSCWDPRGRTHACFTGFSTAKRSHLFYKTRDARPLLLALIGQYPTAEKGVIVRRHSCKNQFCMNPSHYFYGTRADVMREHRLRKGSKLDSSLISEIVKADTTVSSASLAKKYNLPYHTIRRIRSGQTYSDTEDRDFGGSLNESKARLEELYEYLTSHHPQEVRQYQLEYHVTNELECPWHRNGEKTHKGNFGHMGECLDCLKEIQKGRCGVDVTQFDYRWYWQVKRFWDQVDIRGEDECWPWKGLTKKNGTESVAYCPSPFHRSNAQSAMRVAYWLSRGYIGKYRVETQKSCEKFCCNPKHLTARGLDEGVSPSKIDSIKLNYGNIFEHFKKPTLKRADILPSDWRPGSRKWAACVVIGGEMHWGKWQEDFGEADSDLRCMINNLNYDLIDTVEEEGFYPERAIIMEEKYQKSGQTNGLFIGLNEEDGEVSDDNTQ